MNDRECLELVLSYIKENKAKLKIQYTIEGHLGRGDVKVDEAPKVEVHKVSPQDFGQPLPETNDEPIPPKEDDEDQQEPKLKPEQPMQKPQPEDIPEFE